MLKRLLCELLVYISFSLSLSFIAMDTVYFQYIVSLEGIMFNIIDNITTKNILLKIE